ncbi:MAG: type II toxin-antitoxin system VapC family toxin [Leptolyngbya sp. SIO4C1]|nr:type II toxin-antitoxin system VapC family toxin [Leptolyngbya sp. SIO4C1]
MVIDTSAVIAILQKEDEAKLFAELIAADRYRLMSAVSYLESAIVIGSRYGATGREQLDALIRTHAIAVIPFSQAQAEAAKTAYFTYGKGHHPARLNMGDCCSYALAKVTRQPLLFKGDDFSQTDVDGF